MANPFASHYKGVNCSFTLRPSTNDRDKPELTLRQSEVSAVNEICGKGGRAFKRQRLFMDRSLPTTTSRRFWFDSHDDDCYVNEDQYISEEEYDTPIIRRRVSSEFPSRHRISAGSSVSESNYWKTRCLGMQNYCDETQCRLRDAEEDQRQLRQRIRELEEQLLLQTSASNSTDADSKDVDDGNNDHMRAKRDRETSGAVEGMINRGEENIQPQDEEMKCNDKKKTAPPALVIEIKENHQAVSSCFYMTDGEGLNESYDLDMEEDEDISMNVNFCGRVLDDIDDDRNDANINQRGG